MCGKSCRPLTRFPGQENKTSLNWSISRNLFLCFAPFQDRSKVRLNNRPTRLDFKNTLVRGTGVPGIWTNRNNPHLVMPGNAAVNEPRLKKRNQQYVLIIDSCVVGNFHHYNIFFVLWTYQYFHSALLDECRCNAAVIWLKHCFRAPTVGTDYCNLKLCEQPSNR